MDTNKKVVLVGTGFVGMSMAYAMLNQGGVDELVLIDVLKDKAKGEEMDLSHGLPYAPQKMTIKAGDYSECKDANVVVITAGLPQKPGQSRLELAVANTKIVKENDLSTDSAYPEIEVIRELNNIKKLKENNTENIENNSENNEEKTDLAEINDEELNSLDINMNFLGLNLAQIPTRSGDWKAFIIPVLYVLVSVISLRITNPTPKKKDGEEKNSEDEFDPMAQMNKNMNLMFPVMYLAVALIAPLGLALYWLMNSLLMIIERLALNKMLKDEEE